MQTREQAKAGHTPGPWRTSARNPNYVERDIPSTATIAVCHDPSRAHSDARLIAAAPDLLDALRGILDDLRVLRDDLPLKDTRDNHARILNIGDAARTVLAKAEGR